MAKLKFPEHERVEQDLFRNLNGDGGKLMLLITMPVLGLITVVFGFAFIVNEVTIEHALAPVGLVLGWVIVIHSYLNVIVVEHSPEALRIQRRGEQYVIPYTDVYRVTEMGRWFREMGVGDGLADSRKIKVELKTQYPFGSKFTFRTKRDYADAENPSCVARLLQQYTEKAARR